MRGGAPVFAHHSNIAREGFRELEEGQRASFDIAPRRKGPQVQKIKPIAWTPLRLPPDDRWQAEHARSSRDLRHARGEFLSIAPLMNWR